jgi:hypothetical protein
MTDGTRILTIPRHDPVNAFTMAGIARDAGLTVEFLACAATREKRMPRRSRPSGSFARPTAGHDDEDRAVQVSIGDRFDSRR